MPKLYEYLGYTFLFYANDHRPIHVHILRGDCEMKVEIEDEQGNEKDGKGMFIATFKKLRGCHPFSSSEKREILLLITKYREDIKQKWHRVFIEMRSVSPVKINKKLKKETILNKLFNL